jgi:hypothetical protein
LDGSLDLIASVTQRPAHKTRHSQQLITIQKMMESFFAGIVLRWRQISKHFLHCTHKGTFDIVVQWYHSSLVYFALCYYFVFVCENNTDFLQTYSI